MNTSNPIHTKRKGPFPCSGHNVLVNSAPNKAMSSEQVAWMKENKPLLFTGNLWLDLPHLPSHLRHV